MIASVLPDSLSIADRRYRIYLVQCELAPAVLVIRQGRKKDVYAVQELPEPVAGAREFLVLRVTGPKPEFGPYCVTVRNAEDRAGECSCTGFGRWGACKHHAALHDAIFAKSLKPL